MDTLTAFLLHPATIFIIQYLTCIYIFGMCAGFGLFLLKYYELVKHSNGLEPGDVYHDMQWHMILRNYLFYVGLSWYGVYSFITGGQPEPGDE